MLATSLAGAQLLPPAITGNSVGARLQTLFTNPGLRRLGKQSLTALDCPASDLSVLAGVNHSANSDAELLHAFTRQRKADFLAGRIKTVNGWVMADAECALCALIAIA